MPEERRQNLTQTDRGSYYNQEEQLEFLDNKDAFYDGSERDDSENNGENYSENMEAVVRKCSSKQVFLKTLLKSDSNTGVFL